MPNRTQIVCLHEGRRGRSIDPIFIRNVLKGLDPSWIRPWKGNMTVRPVDGGGRTELIANMPTELKTCLGMGSDTTLMVWADLDHDMETGEDLKGQFWAFASRTGITRQEFDQVVFVFAKDRLENWIEFLLDGSTDEMQEGPRRKNGAEVATAAKKLAERCRSGTAEPGLPPSLAWSCRNWRRLVERMTNH